MIPDSFHSLYFIKHTSADFVHSKFAANLNDCNEVLRLVCLWLRCPFPKKSCYAKYENTSVHQSKLSLAIYTKTMHFITLGIQLVYQLLYFYFTTFLSLSYKIAELYFMIMVSCSITMHVIFWAKYTWNIKASQNIKLETKIGRCGVYK